jgi:hypothetical protein
MLKFTEYSINENQNKYPKWVMCVDNKFVYPDSLTIGKIYKCVKSYIGWGGLMYEIQSPKTSEVLRFRSSRFIDIPQGDLQKNERISVNENQNEYPKWVICVNNNHAEDFLTIGKIYKCVSSRSIKRGFFDNPTKRGFFDNPTEEIMYTILSPAGNKWDFLSKRFIDIPQGDIQKNERISV